MPDETGTPQSLSLRNRRYRGIKKKISELKTARPEQKGPAAEHAVKTADLSKLENTRVNLKQGLEAYKKQRSDALGRTDAGSAELKQAADNPKVQEIQSEITENPEEDSEATQSELSLNEPPADTEAIATKTENSGWADSIPESTLMAWWNEFIETQSVRTSSLMKTLRPKVEGNLVVVTVPPNKTEALEAVRFPFNRFIREVSDNKLQDMEIRVGELSEVERKPYTDKEKLDFLIRKHPELDDVIKRLGLRLP